MNQDITEAESVTERQVFDFLASHPDFLSRHPQLLSHLSIPHSEGEVVSLVEHQVKVLREKNRELQGRLIDMLKAAQDNENLLAKCTKLIVCLIDCVSLDQFSMTLTDVLKREFEFDAVSLTLFGRWQRVESARVYASPERLAQQLDCYFPSNGPVCGRLDKSIRTSLFTNVAIQTGSVAILPLGKGGQAGVLAFASRDQLRFSPDMGSLFLEFLSAVCTQMLNQFKDFD
ncbi:DUF484 family protein [Pleionea sp. CnH1-48]|uniref:DUF484 family protein n=1 Tax=Pleionea sp. CnH1-48 TaxID=2954494 RepID=UPI0020973DF2|nr:DUF484 family protein [Pleionea sp. CnH1-48]MCO7227102.1 DUF484 family protein [Pleionea sp. CnH1-48]